MSQRLLQWVLLHGSMPPTTNTPVDPQEPQWENYRDDYDNPLPTTYAAPVQITVGGIYDTQNWESTDANVAAVTVMTSQPVLFLNCNTKANGYCFASGVSNTNITILNSRMQGGALSSKQRRAVVVENIKNLVVENCELTSSAGIYIAGNYNGNHTPAETITIRYNKAFNIDSRTLTGRIHSQFVQLNTVRTNSIYFNDGTFDFYQGVPYVEISWNYIKNNPYESDVEDNFNIYNSRGTQASPMAIFQNYVHGAHYWDFQSEQYSGSGMIADSPGAHRGLCTAYVQFQKNYVTMSNGATFGIAGGNNIDFIDNVGISKSVMDEEDALRTNRTGAATELRGYPGSLYVTDTRYNMNATYNNRVIGHVDGVVGEKNISVGPLGWRNDYSQPSKYSLNPAWASNSGMIILPNPIDRAVEDFYRDQWLSEVAAAGLVLGVIIKSTTPIPDPGTPANIIYYEGFEGATAFDGQHMQGSTTYDFEQLTAPAPIYKGSKVGKWELRKGDAEASGGTRAEVLFAEELALEETWHGFAAYFPSADYPVDSISGEHFNQWHQGGSWGTPMLLLGVKNGHFEMKRRSTTTSTTTTNLGPQIFDEWVPIVIHVKQHLTDGFIKIWIKDVLVYSFTGETKFNDTPGRWKMGVYKSDWNDNGTYKPTNSTIRKWYVDEIRIADHTGYYGAVRPQTT